MDFPRRDGGLFDGCFLLYTNINENIFFSLPFFSFLFLKGEKVLTIYTKSLGQSPVIDDLIFRLHSKIKKELLLQMELLQLNGSIGLLLAQRN
jgi:hypothetical protein